MSRQKIEKIAKPGKQSAMNPPPQSVKDSPAAGKLKGKVAIITGGDSGIGRAVAVAFAAEGADVAIVYLSEDKDAEETARLVEDLGRRCLKIKGDVGDKSFCLEAVNLAYNEFGMINILVNNASIQKVQEDFTKISEEQLDITFRTNVYGYFFMTQAVLPYLKKGDAIISTASVNAYKGNESLIDYSSTKGAEVALTRSLALALSKKGIRVNGVAPGPIWTPLIPSSFPKARVDSFGKDVPLGRPGQPEEVAPCYVFLASEDSSYITGQFLHPNGGTPVNG